MITIEEIVKKLQPYLIDRKLYELSIQLHMPYARLWRIATGRVQNPRFDTIKPLIDFFK